MVGGHEFLKNLALVLCVAAIPTVLFQRLKQPVVLGYLIAGVIVGPHFPIPLVADIEMVHMLSELGVILLMFTLGLEFSLAKLMRIGKTGGVIAIIEVSFMISIGYIIGQLFGWTVQESVFTGAIIGISSTTIIAKAFQEQKVDAKLSELVFGVLVAEDLLAILLVTSLTAVSSGRGLSAGMVMLTIGRLAAFLIGVVAIGILVIPRAVRFIVRLNRPETTAVAAIGICFLVALLAQEFGYSVALGAFLAGSLVSESGEAKEIEHLIQPIRDVFAAIFFVSVGMLIDPALIVKHWGAILVITGTVITGKVIGVSTGAFLSGASTRDSLQAGMSLAQIGEFSFIIAGVGMSLGATGEFLYPIAVAVSAVTTLTTPWLIRASSTVAPLVEQRMPRRLQTFATLYAAWLSKISESPHEAGFWTNVRRLARLIVFDAAALVGLIIGTSLSFQSLSASLARITGLRVLTAGWIVAAAELALCLPFIIGLMRCARSLGRTIANETLPDHSEDPTNVDGTQQTPVPPKGLVVAIQLTIVVLIGGPILALVGAFLPTHSALLILAIAFVSLGVLFWRSASDLHVQVRAGTEVVVDLLARQARVGNTEGADPKSLEEAVQQVLPWFGKIHSTDIDPRSEAIGRTLAELNLRGRTGANVVAIRRAESVVIPTAGEAIRSGDVIALAGSPNAIAAAQLVLSPPGTHLDGSTERMIAKLNV